MAPPRLAWDSRHTAGSVPVSYAASCAQQPIKTSTIILSFDTYTSRVPIIVFLRDDRHRNHVSYRTGLSFRRRAAVARQGEEVLPTKADRTTRSIPVQQSLSSGEYPGFRRTTGLHQGIIQLCIAKGLLQAIASELDQERTLPN